MNTRVSDSFLLILASLLIVFSGSLLVHAQQGIPGTPIQQSSTMLNAATKVANCNVAVNNTCTATMTPAGSNYVYVTGVDLEVCGDATGTVQTNVTWTTTGLTGAPILWAYSANITGGIFDDAAACVYKTVYYSPALKSSTPGTAVTVVSPAAALHTAYTANIFWYEAP